MVSRHLRSYRLLRNFGCLRSGRRIALTVKSSSRHRRKLSCLYLLLTLPGEITYESRSASFAPCSLSVSARGSECRAGRCKPHFLLDVGYKLFLLGNKLVRHSLEVLNNVKRSVRLEIVKSLHHCNPRPVRRRTDIRSDLEPHVLEFREIEVHYPDNLYVLRHRAFPSCRLLPWDGL